MHERMFVPVDSRLCLEALAPKHAESLFACVRENRDHLGRWLSWVESTKSVGDTRAFIATEMAKRAAAKAAAYGVFLDGCLCGVAGFNVLDVQSGRGELGYWLAKSSTEQGIMTRVVRALCAEGFERLALETIEIHCATGNVPSRRVAERVGARMARIEGAAARLHGHNVDHVIYVLDCDAAWQA